jgi:hypothetical protein
LNTAPPGRAGRRRGVPRGPTLWLRTRLHAGEQRGGPGSADERSGSRGRTRLACIRWFVPTVRRGLACGRATIAHAVDGHLTARRRRRQSLLCRGVGRGTCRAGQAMVGMARFCERSHEFLLPHRESGSGKARTKPNGEANRWIGRAVRWMPRRSLSPSSSVQNQTRVPADRSSSPPRCLPAWSDVHGQGPRYPERRHQTRGIEHRSTRTSRAVAGSSARAYALVANTAPRWRAAWWPRVCGRTFRVTERRQDRPTNTLDPNAASVHPLVRAVGGSSDSAPAIPRTPCSWQRPSQPRIARISRMLPIRVIRVIRGQIRSFAAGVGTVSPRATRPIPERRRNCHNVASQQRRRGPPVMNAARRRI